MPLVAVDTHYYGKQVIAPLNIVLYNIFGQGGPDLYGLFTIFRALYAFRFDSFRLVSPFFASFRPFH